MTKQQIPQWARSYFKTTVDKAKFETRSVMLKDSKEWHISRGAIVHRSGRFFKIVGIEWNGPNNEKICQPLIEQREVGTLGFMIIKRDGNNDILVQAKIEPGNVGVCQIAPTYQATASNSAKAHGGKVPSYKKYFQTNAKDVVFQVLQSEQGSRFLGKMNCNIMLMAKTVVKPSLLHKWVPVEKLLDSIDLDYFVNTDARSVLVCSPWQILVGREPFTKNDSSATTKLLRSSYLKKRKDKINYIKDKLNNIKAKVDYPKIVDIKSLKNWQLGPYGLDNNINSSFCIQQIYVKAANREVTHWDQPIINSNGNGRVIMLCATVEGVLQFLVVPRAEPGLVYKAELGPSVVIQPGEKRSFSIPANSKVLAQVMQSDEGGRFFKDIAQYQIVCVKNAASVSNLGGHWLTLGEIKQLLSEEGIFTNEARSVLSLLLKWL